MNTLAILLVVATFSAINAVNTYKDCGSTSGRITRITVNPCPQEPCVLIRGTNVSVEVEFTSNVPTNNVTTSVHGIIGAIPVPFMTSNSCANNNVVCPITANSNNIYRNYIPVLKLYPSLTLIVKWELKDDQGNDLVCFVLPASIADSYPGVGRGTHIYIDDGGDLRTISYAADTNNMSLTVLTCTVIAVTVLAICTAKPINFKTCENAPKTIDSVDISPCSKQPCEFKHGMNVTVTVNFTAPAVSSKLTSEIYGIVAGIPIKFAMPNSNGCLKSGLQCPINSSTKYSYVQFFAVIPTYPLISLNVQWDLKDENGKYEFCFVFPMMIVS
ncbi:uncharacterized protein LOC132558921 [Ylistrum balloti]|uniref:uncharacterized protein LOC132558921 n=1 Tax=Ylistrum balloti TaxID=509963 RepID=UPI002905E1C6|nr:uncharacterized protein LOC132558921 [Ylistrum balloti]